MRDNFFFIIGAQRSGTTYLLQILDEHPEVFMARPVKPEPKFFLDESKYQQGIGHYLDLHFSKHANEKLFGEKSTSYLECHEIGPRIIDFFPEAKVVVLLRNPVNRALSNYLFSKEHGLEIRSLSEVFLKNAPAPTVNISLSVSPFNYLERGDYVKHLHPYNEVFKDRMLVLIHDQFVTKQDEIAGLYRFLSIDDRFIPQSINKVINMIGADFKSSQVDEEIFEFLQDHYLDPIERLEEYLKIDLIKWKQPVTKN